MLWRTKFGAAHPCLKCGKNLVGRAQRSQPLILGPKGFGHALAERLVVPLREKRFHQRCLHHAAFNQGGDTLGQSIRLDLAGGYVLDHYIGWGGPLPQRFQHSLKIMKAEVGLGLIRRGRTQPRDQVISGKLTKK